MWTRRNVWWPTWSVISFWNVMTGAFGDNFEQLRLVGTNVATRATCSHVRARMRLRSLVGDAGTSKNALAVQ